MTSKDQCDIYSYDEKKVHHLHEKMANKDLGSVAKMFKALADENRTKIVYALSEDPELCVCDIATIIGSSVATASHHLRTLHKQGIVKFRKEGKLAFYSLDDSHIYQLIKIALSHSEEVKTDV
ncbi:ArsR/SmtB family transcription factor [Halalkalibacter alkalisediminis]|uniref:ArsR/SmtB family transcription factor n=1 Tax=Halalkalibacter alkalisediminis TaxID=935616 RepID=A0ABV6NP60_9BACI|nr:metalloregulator ArsR/SmtB family transcription factor [Halalkalibacter alkalisediminis]